MHISIILKHPIYWDGHFEACTLNKVNIKDSKFRVDINGLRAWAVVIVILYHFGVFGFSGGFVGVDLFFVISGYLMTGIISRGLAGATGSSKQFSVVEFYISRAKRILPALIVLCIFVILLGWIILSPQEYSALGVHAISALGFFSNVTLWRETGYFDVASHEKLLLHTWSLSVEWQFYIILPLLMLGAWKMRPKMSTLKVVVIAGFLVSLALSVFITPLKPSAAFYLLPTRAWELLAGGCVYFLADRVAIKSSARRLLECLGFVLIIASIFIFDQSSQWPGWRALIPVAGTSLVLFTARQDSGWTSSKVAQWLGECSYSLYLWHWPIVVALVFLNLQHFIPAIIFGLALTVFMGWISYRYIETTARIILSKKSTTQSALLLFFGIALISIPSALINYQGGFPNRVSPQANAIFNEALNKNPRLEECATQAKSFVSKDHPVPNCTYGNEGTVKAVMMGDSHSSSLVTSLKAALEHGDVLQWTANACPLAMGIYNNYELHQCNDFLLWAVKEAKKLPSGVPIFLVNRFSAYLYGANETDQGLSDLIAKFEIEGETFNSDKYLSEMSSGILKTVCELSADRKVYIVRPIPEMGIKVPEAMGRSMRLGIPKDGLK